MHEKRAFEIFSDSEVSKLETGNGKLARSHHRMREILPAWTPARFPSQTFLSMDPPSVDADTHVVRFIRPKPLCESESRILQLYAPHISYV